MAMLPHRAGKTPDAKGRALAPSRTDSSAAARIASTSIASITATHLPVLTGCGIRNGGSTAACSSTDFINFISFLELAFFACFPSDNRRLQCCGLLTGTQGSFLCCCWTSAMGRSHGQDMDQGNHCSGLPLEGEFKEETHGAEELAGALKGGAMRGDGVLPRHNGLVVRGAVYLQDLPAAGTAR